jgi:hypothetical protein
MATREWRAKNKEHTNAKQREWRAKNPEYSKIKQREWRAKNPERAKALQQRWVAKNPERAKAKEQRYHIKHPERRKQIQQKWRNKSTAVYLLGFCRARAKKQKRNFSLTLSWIEKKLASGICAQTGVPFDLIQGNYDILGGRNPWFPSIDRIDSCLDYHESNCQIVCAMYNFAKQTWNDAEVLIMARTMVSYHDKDPLE